MRFHTVTTDDMKNGNGLRVVLWVAGCSHHCKGCQNPFTQDVNGGKIFNEWEEALFWEYLSQPHIKGATFSGGDPLHPANREKIMKLCKQIRTKFPEKDIWIYTGYRVEKEEDAFIFTDGKETFSLELSCVDVIVDGPFQEDVRKEDQKNHLLVKWCGDSTQRVIDVKKSVETGQIEILAGCKPMKKE